MEVISSLTVIDHFPFVVQVPTHKQGKERRHMILWLEEHMGERVLDSAKNSWSHPMRGVYRFREQSNALEFTLRWL